MQRSLTFVVHNVSSLFEIEGIDDFIEPIIFISIQVLRLTTVPRTVMISTDSPTSGVWNDEFNPR